MHNGNPFDYDFARSGFLLGESLRLMRSALALSRFHDEFRVILRGGDLVSFDMRGLCDFLHDGSICLAAMALPRHMIAALGDFVTRPPVDQMPTS